MKIIGLKIIKGDAVMPEWIRSLIKKRFPINKINQPENSAELKINSLINEVINSSVINFYR